MKQKLLLFLSLTLPLTATLISLQILAPDRFKPLTNRLLDYPHVTPSINLERGVFQTSFSPSRYTSDLSLHSYRSIQALLPQPLTIARVVDDVYVPPKSSAPAPKKSTSAPRGSVTKTLKQEIQDIIINTPPAAPAEPAPSTPPAPPKVAPKQVLDEARQETYLTNYGAEAGRYGWNYDTGSPATTDQWNDPNAKIAGTYIGPNGQRYTVNLESTKQAESSFVNAIANKITTLSNDQVLDYAKELPGSTSCSAADTTCQQQLIKDTLAIIGQQSVATRAIDQNLTTAIQDAQQQNAAFQAKIATFLDPNSSREKILNCAVGNTSCRETTYEDYLKQLGVDKDSIPTLLADRQTNIQNQARLKKFYDPTASTADILECPPGAPKCGGKTLESFLANLNVDSDKIPDLIKERSTNIANYQTDLKLISKFADALISTSDLAKEVCSGDFGCVKDFNREDYLGSLHYQELAGNAKSAYQLSLFNFSKLVDEPSFKDLPATTQNTLLNANTSVQQAFAAYSFEHNQTPGTIVTPESSNQLALDFANKIESNPDIIKEYSAKFADHKDLYQGLIDTTRLFALTEGEKNAVTTAQLKDIAIHATISGLSNNGQVVAWDQAAPQYKEEARQLACKQDPSLTGLCRVYAQQGSTSTALLDEKIKNNSSQYLQQIFDAKTGANIQLSTSFSNVATVNNPLVDQQLVTKAIQFANQKADPNVPAYMTEQHYNPDFTPLTETEKTQLANQYLDRQLVTETYKVGGGLAAGMAGFSAGMTVGGLACVATGIGIAASPICALIGGAVGGISGALAAQVPLYEMTATEYQEQRGGDDLTHSIFQSLYSNQGAWGDEGMGRSITTRNNQFALYDAINTATDGQLISQIQTNPELQANLAIQGQVLNQWEVNQNRQESWTYASLPIAAITGSLNVSVGSQLAKSFTGRAITESGFKALNVLSQAPTFAASTALNRVQTAAQFNSTGGDASLLTTPTQVAWQVCIMSQDPNSIECLNKKLAVDTEIATNKKFAMDQAFYTDLLMQIYQTATSFRQSQAQFRAQIDYAESQGITTTNRTLAAITADLAHLNDPNLTAKLAAAELTTNIPKIDQTQPISTDGLSELLMSKKVVQTEENGKPRLAFDQTHAPTSEETAVMTHVNNLLGVMEKTSGFNAILPEQLGAVTLSLDALATQKIAKTNSPDSLLLDQSVKPGVNPDAKTGGGKNTVIVPLLEKIALDGGQLTLHLAPEANMAGNRQTIENLRAFYDTDIYVAVNQKNAAGAVTDRYFTNLDGTRLPTETVLARIQQDGKAPMILADADTAMFALNEVIKIERGLAKSDSISSVWEKIWNSGPTVTADEVGTLSGHWQTTLGDPVAIAKLRKSQASLHLNDGAEVLSIYHATGDLEIIRQARSGELVLEKNPANRSLKPLPDEHTNQIIDISLEHAGSDKKIPSALKDELGRIQSLSNLDEKRHAFDTLRKHTPIELDTIYGKNASHAVALANAYNDAIYSRLSIIADIPGNDFRTVSGSVGTTIELAEGKTITGQQYSEVMLKLALQDEGSRALSIADTQLVPLDQLSIASQAVVVDLNDMFSHAGSMIGYDATDRLATAKTGLHAIYESTQLHAPKSVSLAQTLPETAVATARLVRDQFDQGKTALVIETNINKYSLDDATTAHTAAALKQLRPGENLYLALDNGDGSYQLYKVKGPDRTTWDLITGTPKSAEELYLASRTAIDADSTNNRLLALFENKTRGENFKPQTGIAPDIKESIVIGNPDTSISDTTQQGAGRVRVGGNDPAAEYHFVAYVDNQDTFNQLNSVSLTKPQDLPGIILSHLEQNQARTEGYISLERNIKAINDGQVSNLIAHLYQDAQNNPKLIAQLAELENQIKNSGLAFATTPAEESTANALHDQYLFTRVRIENILTISEQNGVPTQKISSLRITFNLDEPTLPLSSFAGMLKPNFDNSDLTGYHLALAKNIGTFENVPEKYLAGSPTQPVKSIASTLQPTTTSSLTSRVSTWIQAQIPTSIPLASSIASLVNYPTNLLATALRTASSIINPTIPVLNNQPIVNLLALPDTTLSFLTNDNQAIAFFRLNNTLYYQAENVDPIALTSDTDALAYLPSPDTISRIVLNDEDLDPSSYRAPGNLLSDSPITKTPGEPIDLRNVGLITSTQKFVQNILSQLSISPAKITTALNPPTATLSKDARDQITPILSREEIDLTNVGLVQPSTDITQDTLTQLSNSPVNITAPANNFSARISMGIRAQIISLLNRPPKAIINPENLSIKNELNSNFEIILNDLPEAIPASFRQQARLAAYYFQALANNEALTSVDGQDLSNLANKFFDDFAHTGFVNAHYDYLNLTNQPTDDYYPSWITNKLASVRQGYYEYTEAEKTQIGQYFESYGHQSASSESNQQNGYYYNFYDVKGNKSLQQVQEISNPATNYKMYIENSDLLKTETIGKTLDTLALQGLHPHSYKLLENSRLVLYWDVLSIEQANAIQEIFSQSSIYVRGPAQDPVRIVSSNGVPKMEIYWSNDSSLGENSSNPFKWENNQFNINEFYKQWLRLTFAANKNPSNPNQQSFIQAIIPENTNLNAYISQISQLPSNGLSLLLTHEFVSTIDLFNQQATDTNLVIPPVADTLASPPAVEQESVAHPLTTAQLELLHDVADNDNQPDLTRELLRDSRLFPKDALTIDGITFYLSAIIQTPGYQQALMYTMLQDGRIIPRVLYKSNSDGGWRSTPGYEAWNGIYSKGSGVSYTQETKPHEAINQYFNSTHYKINYPENLIKKKFNLTELLKPSQSKNIIITFDQEQEIYDDREVLRIMQAYQPGYYSDAKYNGKNFANAFGNFDFSSRELSGFLPKFTQAPEKIEKSNHTILGDITLETYSATLQGRPVKWVMAYDAQGRTWIERIYFADTKINSYGVYSEIINSGALTNKPLEYRSQISQLHPNSEYVDYSKSYVDITPLLSNLLPIRQFSAARNIKRVTPARSVASIKLEQNKKVELKKEDYPVDTPATIGRQSGNTLQLSGFSMVSRNHLSVYYKDNSWWYVEDLGTTNGTTIDGKRATANTAQQLTVGNHKIVLGTQATVQITVDPKTRNMTTTLLNRPLKGCSDCETVIAVTQKSLMKIDAAIAAKNYSEASRLLGLLTSYVQTDHRYTENLIQEGLIEQVLQRNAILVNHSTGFDAAIVHAQAAIQLTEALLEQNNVPLSILSSQTPQAYDAQELINPPYRDADMQLLLDFRYSMNDRKNWLIQEQKNAPQSTAVQTLGTKLHEQAGTIRQFIGTTLSFIRQDTKLQGELETIITPITQQSSSPKSAQQAALDALLGRTMGISTIPDFTEIGQNLAAIPARATEWVRNIPISLKNYNYSQSVLREVKKYRTQELKDFNRDKESVSWDKSYNPTLRKIIDHYKQDMEPDRISYIIDNFNDINISQKEIMFTNYIPKIINSNISAFNFSNNLHYFIKMPSDLQQIIVDEYFPTWVSANKQSEISEVLVALDQYPSSREILPVISSWVFDPNYDTIKNKYINIKKIVETLDKYPGIKDNILPYTMEYLANSHIRSIQDFDSLLGTLSQHIDILATALPNVNSWLKDVDGSSINYVVTTKLNNLRVKKNNDKFLADFKKPSQYLNTEDAQTEIWQNITQKLVRGNFGASPDYYDLYLYKESHQSEWNQMAQKYPALNSIFDGAEDAIEQHQIRLEQLKKDNLLRGIDENNVPTKEFRELYTKNRDRLLALTSSIVQDMYYGYLPSLTNTHTQESLLYMLANTPNTPEYNETYDKAMTYYLAFISNSIDYSSKSKYLTNYRIIFQSNLSENTIYSLSRSPLMDSDTDTLRDKVVPALEKLSAYIDSHKHTDYFTYQYNQQLIKYLSKIPTDQLDNYISFILADPTLLPYLSGDGYVVKFTAFGNLVFNDHTFISQITSEMSPDEILAKFINYFVPLNNQEIRDIVLSHSINYLDNPNIINQVDQDLVSFLQTFRDIPLLDEALAQTGGNYFYNTHLKGKNNQDMLITTITELTQSGQIETSWKIMENQFDQLIDSLPLDQQNFWRAYQTHPFYRLVLNQKSGLDYYTKNMHEETTVNNYISIFQNENVIKTQGDFVLIGYIQNNLTQSEQLQLIPKLLSIGRTYVAVKLLTVNTPKYARLFNDPLELGQISEILYGKITSFVANIPPNQKVDLLSTEITKLLERIYIIYSSSDSSLVDKQLLFLDKYSIFNTQDPLFIAEYNKLVESGIDKKDALHKLVAQDFEQLSIDNGTLKLAEYYQNKLSGLPLNDPERQVLQSRLDTLYLSRRTTDERNRQLYNQYQTLDTDTKAKIDLIIPIETSVSQTGPQNVTLPIIQMGTLPDALLGQIAVDQENNLTSHVATTRLIPNVQNTTTILTRLPRYGNPHGNLVDRIYRDVSSMPHQPYGLNGDPNGGATMGPAHQLIEGGIPNSLLTTIVVHTTDTDIINDQKIQIARGGIYYLLIDDEGNVLLNPNEFDTLRAIYFPLENSHYPKEVQLQVGTYYDQLSVDHSQYPKHWEVIRKAVEHLKSQLASGKQPNLNLATLTNFLTNNDLNTHDLVWYQTVDFPTLYAEINKNTSSKLRWKARAMLFNEYSDALGNVVTQSIPYQAISLLTRKPNVFLDALTQTQLPFIYDTADTLAAAQLTTQSLFTNLLSPVNNDTSIHNDVRQLSSYLSDTQASFMRKLWENSWDQILQNSPSEEKSKLQYYHQVIAPLITGSGGRGEISLGSDLDYALLVDDTALDIPSGTTKEEFLKELSNFVNNRLAPTMNQELISHGIRADAGLGKADKQPFTAISNIQDLELVIGAKRQTEEPTEILAYTPLYSENIPLVTKAKNILYDNPSVRANFTQFLENDLIDKDDNYLTYYEKMYQSLAKGQTIEKLKESMQRVLNFKLWHLLSQAYQHNWLTPEELALAPSNTWDLIDYLESKSLLTAREATSSRNLLANAYKLRILSEIYSTEAQQTDKLLKVKNITFRLEDLSYSEREQLFSTIKSFHDHVLYKLYDPDNQPSKQNVKSSSLPALLPLPALTGLGARAGGSILSAVSTSPLVSLLPNLPLLTYNTKIWIDNLGLVPLWLREWVQTSKQVWTNRHLTRVSLFPSNIIKMLNNPSLTKAKDIFGFEYSVRGKDGAIIKSGKLTEYTDIHLPATDDYNLNISGLTLSGADILAQYPDYQTYSWIDNAAINSVLILSVLGFGLGMITMLWTLADTVFKTQAGIYYFFVNTFGTNFANVVLGQFRDIFTLTGIFGMTFSMNRDLVYKFGKWFALFLINMFAVGWMGGEFWQANLRGDMVDIADLIAFSVVPISTIIYGAYSYLRHIRG